uniref:Uncharacterized protein n=1 Tax=Vibrio tasmaniensis TaxID=212663 RepID=A0A0H3ZUP6_9VIBR|nr:hypothetical protein [Vibrio tasmaniensis]
MVVQTVKFHAISTEETNQIPFFRHKKAGYYWEAGFFASAIWSEYHL